MRRLMLIALAICVLTVPAFAAKGLDVNGEHYNLNLLGKNNCPGDDMVGSNRHSIFVQLYYEDPDANDVLGDNPGNVTGLVKTNKIFLAPGTDFQVTDGNACNKGGAAFTLPSDVATKWTVYVRELGKPGGTGDIRTCGIAAGSDGVVGTADDEIVCSTYNVELQRKAGKPVWRNVTPELTTISYLAPIYALDGVTVIGYTSETANLFDPDFYQYFWDYDNNGLRLVQLRFYPAQ